MDSILFIDLLFLLIFCVGISLFLFKNRKNLKREGLIYLYRTKLGIKAINRFSKKYSNFLRGIKYLVIIVGFILMVFIVFLLATNAYAYLKSPKQVIEATNGAPPIAPLVPYFPKLFGLESFFPNFYFSYFLIALAIVAVAHEFSHGVFMKTFGVKIKSTGFIFLGPILGAFVEEDQNTFEKQTNSEQMAILAAGVFANIILALVFFIFLVVFFKFSYAPAGYIFSGYQMAEINSNQIVSFENFSEDFVKITTPNGTFYTSTEIFNRIQEDKTLLENSRMIVYADSPAFRSQIRGAIVEVDGIKISDLKSFQNSLDKKLPGEVILLKTEVNGETFSYNISLEEHPLNSSEPFLGIIGSKIVYKNNVVGFFFKLLAYEDPYVLYKPIYNPSLTDFVRYLFYWIALINFFVALFNMLPLGILDGGRFTYLLILSITKSKSKSKKLYKIISSTIGLIFFAIIFGWLFAKFLK